MNRSRRSRSRMSRDSPWRSRRGLDTGRGSRAMMTVPSRADILREIIAILEGHLGVHSPGAIDEDTRCFADLGLASIDAVVLSEALQNHYDRSLPFHEL